MGAYNDEQFDVYVELGLDAEGSARPGHGLNHEGQ